MFATDSVWIVMKEPTITDVAVPPLSSNFCFALSCVPAFKRRGEGIQPGVLSSSVPRPRYPRTLGGGRVCYKLCIYYRDNKNTKRKKGNANHSNKIAVIFWLIHSKACLEVLPELNRNFLGIC